MFARFVRHASFLLPIINGAHDLCAIELYSTVESAPSIAAEMWAINVTPSCASSVITHSLNPLKLHFRPRFRVLSNVLFHGQCSRAQMDGKVQSVQKGVQRPLHPNYRARKCPMAA